MPFRGDNISLTNLRQLARDLVKQEGGAEVRPFLYCDAEQRQAVSTLSAFVPARHFGTIKPTRRDWGACEQFRFLWLPAPRAEGS